MEGDFADEYNETLTNDEIQKIGVSWNVGLGDLFGERDKSYQNPAVMSLVKSSTDNGIKEIDVQFRGTYDYSMCGYQRNKSLEILNLMKEVKKNDMLSKIDFESYLQEIATSKIVISPYGWGEICSRDFEAFIEGALLLKPDMSHMTTYPNWYVANETYVPTKWDFSDFKEKILEMISSDKRRIQITENAQATFLHHRNTNEGKDEFARHIISQIEGL